MFSDVRRASLRGHRVDAELLCELRFVAKAHFLHNGGGQLKSKDGQEWTGLDGIGFVSGLGASAVGQSRSVQMGLEAEDPAIKQAFTDQRTDVEGRQVIFWGQFYDPDMQPLDDKFHIYTGIADKLRMEKAGPRTRKMTLLLEDFFVRRRRSALAVVSHADQQMRDPIGTGFIYQPDMVDKIINFFDAND